MQIFRGGWSWLILVLVGTCLSPAVSGESYYDGVIIDRPGVYDAYPSHLFIDGTHHIYFCGGSSSADGIFRSSKTSPLLSSSGWSTPVLTFDRTNSPWAEQHVCDPSLLRGEFSYESASYEYVLFYTADDSSLPVGVSNAIGVAYSNDLVSWVPHAERVISPFNDPGAQGYGAGESSVAWNPQSPTFSHVYRDSSFSTPFHGSVLHVSSTDGVAFSSPPTELGLSTTTVNTGANDIAYSPYDEFWYAVRTKTPPGDPPPLSIELLRSVEKNTLFSGWRLLDEWGMSFSGEVANHQPGLARNENGTLFVDEGGFMYIFLTTGDWFPNFNSWRIAQIRRRLLPARAPLVLDTFSHVGPFRAAARGLDGTRSEVGGALWTAGPDLVFNNGNVTTSATGSGGFATVPIAEPGLAGAPPFASVRARINPTGSTWAAIGFSTNHAGVFGGEVWMLIKPATGTVEVVADGTSHLLVSASVPATAIGETDAVLGYDQSSNTVSAWINGVQILDEFNLDSLDGGTGFTPNIDRAGFHLNTPTAGQTVIGDFGINRFIIFSDGFESGDLTGWSGAKP